MKSFFLHHLTEALPKTRILLVGVGGIGCEILKNFSKYTLGSLHIVDFDHIELSNLNRQFYFRAEHIGRSKAEVAAEIMAKLAPQLQITVHNCSIFDQQFDSAFFAQFDAVILALDNPEARSYVNRQCLKTGTPVFESGTHGFAGQTYPIFPGLSRCYDCFPREPPKTMQVCTIRTLPKKPEHCLFWAKNVFHNLFGENQTGDQTFSIVGSVKNLKADHGDEFAIKFMKNLFLESLEILKQVEGPKFAHVKLPPAEIFTHATIKLTDLKSKGFSKVEFAEYAIGTLQKLKTAHSDNGNNTIMVQETDEPDCSEKNSISPESCLSETLACACHLLEHLAHQDRSFTFEKDEDDHSILLVALSNLRSYNFGIQMQDHEEGRKLIGNIIPALSSTNSLVAGLLVQELFKFLVKKNHYNDLQKSINDNGITEPDLQNEIILKSRNVLFPLRNFELYVANFKAPRITRGNLNLPNEACSLCKAEKHHFALNFESGFDVITQLIRTEFFSEFRVFSKNNLLFEVEEDAGLNDAETNSQLSSDSSDFDFNRTLASYCQLSNPPLVELEFLAVHDPKPGEKAAPSQLLTIVNWPDLEIGKYKKINLSSDSHSQGLLKFILDKENLLMQSLRDQKKRTPKKEFNTAMLSQQSFNVLEDSVLSVPYSDQDSILMLTPGKYSAKKIRMDYE